MVKITSVTPRLSFARASTEIVAPGRASRGAISRITGGKWSKGSKTVTAVIVLDDLDWKSFNGELKRRGLVLAGGQGKLTGKVFRVGHLGSVTVGEILEAIETIEAVSLAWGREVEAGAAVAAAERAAAGAALTAA